MSEPDPTADSLLGAVARYIDDRGLLVGVDRLAVACSGGGDSVVLLDILQRLQSGYGLELIVVHLNHRWRGEASDADAHFVARLASERGLELAMLEADPAPASGSLEAHFRDERLRMFGEVCAKFRAEAVALGHTRDDQAETVVMNLARGSGRLGLGGIRPRARVRDLVLVRPLLQQRRERLRRYATERGLSWCEDASNDESQFVRNRVRMEVLPALEAGVPGAIDNIARGADLLRDEERWLEAMAAAKLDAMNQGAEGALAVDVEQLGSLPKPLSRRIVREALRRVKGSLRGVHLDHVDAVMGRVVTGVERARDLPGVRVSLRDGSLRFERLENRRVVARSESGKS